MTIETEVSDLTDSTTALLNAVGAQQIIVDNAVTAFTATTNTVDTELNNVDNTSDADKPVSTATATSIATRQPTLGDGDNISTINGLSVLSGTPLVIARGQVEIPVLSYENRATLRTPVLPVPLTGDVVTIPHLGQFQYTTTFEYFDDDEMVIQAVNPSDGVTPIGQWVLTLPAFDWTEIQKMFEHADTWERWEDIDRDGHNGHYD
jgi:hypothetical protein